MNTSEAKTCDVLVIGGGGAGLGAALQLGRARRSVVVVDAGEPRNAPAAHVHGYLGHEGRPPGELLAIARDEVRSYGVEVLDGRVSEVVQDPHQGFRAELADGAAVIARRVLLATGLVDRLPDIPGLAERWGHDVIHCPYCHGWEVQDQELVVISTGPLGAHQAGLFRQLSDRVTYVVHDGAGPDATARTQLAARGVAVIEEPVAEVLVEDDKVSGVRLEGGRVVAADAIVVGPRFEARADAVASLGIMPVEQPSGAGTVIEADETGQTSVPGVYVAGNVADSRAQVLQAAAAGAMAGAMINADLVTEDTAGAVRAADGGAREWDERYAEPRWSGRPNGVLVAEAASLAPGRALDVGAGEGADAIWLAENGWTVTAVDISQVALDRAATAATDAGVEVDWVRADIVAEPPEVSGFDLVSVHYPALRRTPDDDAIRVLLTAVAPGGTLLVVGHGPLDAMHAHAHSHGLDPADYVKPSDVTERLDDGWTLVTDEMRPRVDPTAEGHPITHDTVVVARRTG